MRITTFTLFNQLTRSLNDNLRSMSKLSNMLSSGKKINNPSDDVSGMMKAMDYKVSINELEQFRRNIDEADSSLGFADTAMSSVTNALTRARELTVQGSTDSVSAENRAAIAKEIANLRDEIMSLANSKFKNKNIFSGVKTDTQAFDSSYNYQGDSGEVSVMIDHNATMALNIPGDDAFSSGGTSYMETLDDLYDALTNTSGTSADIRAYLDDLDDALEQTANVRADIGARMNHLDNRRSNLEERDVTLKTFLSEAEDTDIASTISEISKTELALESLRQSGAATLSKSLFDFLR